MKFIMFTKHLQGLELPEIITALQAVEVQGADLCVRPGYPVNPENAEKDTTRCSETICRSWFVYSTYHYTR